MTGPPPPSPVNPSSRLAGATSRGLLDILIHIDRENSSRSHVVIGFSSAVLALVVPRMPAALDDVTWGTAGFIVLCLSSLGAVLSAVATLRPTGDARNAPLNLFYPGNYLHQCETPDLYAQHLAALFQSEDRILEAFAKEPHIYGKTVMKQAKYLERSILILVSGIVLATLLQFVNWVR